MSGHRATESPVDAWDAVAANWDRSVEYVDRQSGPAIRALIEALHVGPGERVLEIAAGPGPLAAVWSERVGDAGRVVVTDIAPAMVDVAARRSAELANVETAVVDASSIGYPDGSFDVVACSMGLMFTLEPDVALAEIHRVLDHGGRFGALTWGRLEDNPWMTCVGMAAMANGLVSGGPPVGPGGIFSLGDPAALRVLVESAGFGAVTVDEIDLTFEADSVDAHVARVSSLAGPLAGAFAAADEDTLARVRATAAQLAAGHTRADGALALPARANLVTGRR